MKNTLLTILIAVCTVGTLGAKSIVNAPYKQAMTYEVNGRLGNQLITYLCTKWIAEVNNLPMLYVPFKYADQFAFHETETLYRSNLESSFKKKQWLHTHTEVPSIKGSKLIVVNFFCNDNKNSRRVKMPFRYVWNDPDFRAYAKQLLKPRYPVRTVALPKGKLTVLAHVRTGGGFDSKKTQLQYPNKFPPHSFYIAGVESISALCSHPPMYVYLMTDDLHPEDLAKKYRRALAHLKNVEIAYRKGDSGPSANVLEDFFSIPKFTCLIRGSSTFAIAAALLTDYMVEISPKTTHVENGKVVVDYLNIQVAGSKEMRLKAVDE